MTTLSRGFSLALLFFAACQWSLAAEPASEPGYLELFNGKDLTGWAGDERFWSVQDGVIHGETTAETKAPHNTFLIWQGGKLKDFHLKVRFKLGETNNNSGLQYRSEDRGDFRIKGYQAEIDHGLGKVGFLYHEGGRGWLVNVGDFMVIDEAAEKKVVGKVSNVEQLKQVPYYNKGEWNEYHIIARGNHIVHYLNGFPTMELIDRDQQGRHMEGVLALQLHAGAPMSVSFKDIRVKHLDASYGGAIRLFDGESFEGWTFSSPNQKEAWSVVDGALRTAGRPIGYIRTKQDYTSYVLRMQIRHEKAGNSGVLLRMIGDDKVWPRSIEAQGQKGALGDIWNIDKFPMKVAEERTRGRHTRKMVEGNERPVGEWNDYEIVLAGGRLELYVNNLLQNVATDCEEVPGKICLQSEGTPVQFRNIVLIPIE